MKLLTLSELPTDHPLRNRPLGEIGAQVRYIHQTEWQSVEEWNIRTKSYNQLGAIGKNWHEFRAIEQ